MKVSFSILMISLLFLTGCCQDDEYCMVDRSNLIHHSIGDEFIYLNNSVSDTLRISNYQETLDGEEDQGSTLCHTVDYREFITYTLSSDSSNHHIRYYCDDNKVPKIYLFGSYLSPEKRFAFQQFDGIIYYNVTRYIPTNNNHGEITILWFNQKFGIIKYKKTGNRTFILKR